MQSGESYYAMKWPLATLSARHEIEVCGMSRYLSACVPKYVARGFDATTFLMGTLAGSLERKGFRGSLVEGIGSRPQTSVFKIIREILPSAYESYPIV
jgi:hypothetical protein